ncbi:MAG: tRNA 2-thiouridine(34) synthase MnmA, partial [Ignavibacteriaceae bacterium]|nr:tRNA 2-thiouridine(34) synthase MnmA [Ignavibacteriaceae bacterium]
SRALFPVGKYNKAEIRALAEKFDLPTRKRKDSQGICFLGQIKFKKFVEHHLGENEGEIVDVDSQKVMGKHPGYYFYTIGQRSGLKLGGGPWFVVSKDVKKNVVYISKENKAVRERDEFKVGNFNWISGNSPQATKLIVKLRHGANYYNCKIEMLNDSSVNVKIDKPDKGIAPGQFAVFYDNDVCLGGGVILQD